MFISGDLHLWYRPDSDLEPSARVTRAEGFLRTYLTNAVSKLMDEDEGLSRKQALARVRLTKHYKIFMKRLEKARAVAEKERSR